MKIATAPEKIANTTKKENVVSIFLAGGITNCSDWRTEVIAQLNKNYAADNRVIILNPKRENFDVSDTTETLRQIKWEHRALKYCDIFGMFFCESESVQPICLYELGKQLSYYNSVFDYNEKIMHTVIGVEEGYSRKEDVVIQSNLMGYPVDILRGIKEQRYEDFANKLIFKINSFLYPEN